MLSHRLILTLWPFIFSVLIPRSAQNTQWFCIPFPRGRGSLQGQNNRHGPGTWRRGREDVLGLHDETEGTPLPKINTSTFNKAGYDLSLQLCFNQREKLKTNTWLLISNDKLDKYLSSIDVLIWVSHSLTASHMTIWVQESMMLFVWPVLWMKSVEIC